MQDKLRLILEKAVKDSTGDSKIELDRQSISILESLGYVAGVMETDFSFDQSKDDPKDLIESFVSLQKAHLLVYEERFAEAMDLYEKLVRERSGLHEAYSKMGFIATKQTDYAAAARYYKEAVRLRPDNAQYMVSLGTAYGELGQYAQAVRQYEEALKKNPKNTSAHNDLGAVLFRMGKYTDA